MLNCLYSFGILLLPRTNAKANYLKQKTMENKDNIKSQWKILKAGVPRKLSVIQACVMSILHCQFFTN